MPGRRNKDKPQINVSLPPCRVCGEPGCGFHYGVTTCDACKGFFRRSIVRTEPYVCTESHLCHVGPSTSRRQSCPKCRYDKCVAVGMSRQACKVGRYTKLKKSKDMVEIMEALGNDDLSCDDAVIKTVAVHFNGLGNESSHTPIQNTFSYGSNYFPIQNMPYKEATVWNVEGLKESSRNDNDTRTSSGHLSYGSFNEHEDKRIDNDYNESVTVPSCLIDAHCGNFSGGMTIKPLAVIDCTLRDNYMTEPYSTVLKVHSRVNKDPFLIGQDTHKTTTLSSAGYISYPDSSNFKDYSPPSTPIPHSCFRTSPSSDIHPGLGFSFNSNREELLTYEATQQPLCNKQPHMQDLEETHQCRSAIVPPQSTHENEYSTRYNSDQRTTQINGEQNNMSSAKAVDTEHWITHYGNYSKSDHATGIHNTFVQENDKTLIGFRKNSVIQSVGLPLDKAHHCYERNVDQGPNLDDSFLRAPTTKESTKTCTSRIAYSNASKRRLESENEKEDIPKKPCAGVQILKEPKTLKDKSVTHACKSDQTSLAKPMFLLYVVPNVSNYILSVFDRFPFTSYEKESLSSILKNCYEINGNQTSTIENCYEINASPTDYSITSQSSFDTHTDNLIESYRALANVPSQGKRDNTLDFSYDDNKMDELFSYLMDINKLYFSHELTLMSDLEIQTAQDTFWDLCQFKEMVHGKMKFVDHDKYYTILETTGIDVDKRKEVLLAYLYPMEEYTWKKIKFFNSIPGFKDFTLADKITLTKSCSHEYYSLTRHRGIDTNKHIAIDEMTRTAYRLCHFEDIFPTFKATAHQIYDLVSELKKLALSQEEIVVLKALMLTNPDAEEILEQPDIVEECHKTYRQCLLNLVKKRHGPQADDRFATIIKGLYSSIHKARDVRRKSLVEQMDGIIRMVDRKELPLFMENMAPYPKRYREIDECEIANHCLTLS